MEKPMNRDRKRSDGLNRAAVLLLTGLMLVLSARGAGAVSAKSWQGRDKTAVQPACGGIERTQEGWEKFEQPSGGTYTSPRMWYWIYKPENIRPGKPLVIYLHSTVGCCNQALIDPLPQMINAGIITDPEAVIVVPQLPGNFESKWSAAAESVTNLVNRLVEEYQLDPERVAMTGFSLGGVYCWDIANSTPGRYTRFMSICGRVHYLRIKVESFEGCEVRVYTALRDPNVNPASAISFAEWLAEAGIPATHTEMNLSHAEVPRAVFADPEVQEWLWMKPAESTGR